MDSFFNSISLSFDSYGNVAIQTSKANVFKNQEGAAMGIASIGVSSSLSGTSLDSVDDLEDISINAGISASTKPPRSLGADLILDENLNIKGGGISASTSVGSPVDIHMVASTTTTHYKANPFEAIKNTWRKFTKWLGGVVS